ncbi:13757_t:CDS:2, partial [Funneliformis geosporum]
GRIKKPAYSKVAQWVKVAWKNNIENEPVEEEILIDENMYSDNIENYENLWN